MCIEYLIVPQYKTQLNCFKWPKKGGKTPGKARTILPRKVIKVMPGRGRRQRDGEDGRIEVGGRWRKEEIERGHAQGGGGAEWGRYREVEMEEKVRNRGDR
jgi:hypothetical protein